MTDLDQRFREAGGIRVPDLWPDIAVRDPGVVPPEARWRRPVAIVTALLVAAAGIGFAGWALLAGREHEPTLTAPICAGALEVVPHPELSPELGIETLAGVDAIGPNDAWAVGSSGFATRGPGSPIDQARILQWDGAEWAPVAAPVIDTFEHNLLETVPVQGRLGFLQSVDGVARDDVWAVGHAGGTLIEHWDGEAWSWVSSPKSGREDRASLVSVSAVAADNAWAVGSDPEVGPLMLHWDGTRWSEVELTDVPNPKSAHLVSVVGIGPDDAWAAGGVFNEADQGWQALVLHWDGSRWRDVSAPSVVPTGTTELMALAASSSDDVWAVGFWSDESHTGSIVHSLAEHWDGTSWTIVDTPPMAGDRYRFLNGVAAAAPNDVWAVGSRAVRDTGRTDDGPLVEHWDGVEWQEVDAGPPARSLNAASALATGEIWSVGTQGNEGGGVIAHRSCTEASPPR